MSLLVLSSRDVAHVSSTLSSHVLTSLMAFVFVRLHSPGAVQPHRVSIVTKHFNTLFMPARVDELGSAIKTVAVPRGINRTGIPATTLVLDDETGAVSAIVNARSLTALRTAAGSLLATRLLGPPTPKLLLCFGAGQQIEAHIDLFLRSYPSLRRVFIVNRSQNARLGALIARLTVHHTDVKFDFACAINGLGLDHFDLHNVVSQADIICAATSSHEPLFRGKWVKIGTHVNLVGSYTPEMAEVDNELIRRAGKVLVDSREACLKEAGELIDAQLPASSMIEVGEIVQETGEAVTSKAMEVKAAGDVTIFKSVGIGLQDVAIAKIVVEKASSIGVGVRIPDFDDY